MEFFYVDIKYNFFQVVYKSTAWNSIYIKNISYSYMEAECKDKEKTMQK